jgi:hypothetical protein
MDVRFLYIMIFIIASLPISVNYQSAAPIRLGLQLQLAGYEFNDLTVLRIEQDPLFFPDNEMVALQSFSMCLAITA